MQKRRNDRHHRRPPRTSVNQSAACRSQHSQKQYESISGLPLTASTRQLCRSQAILVNQRPHRSLVVVAGQHDIVALVRAQSPSVLQATPVFPSYYTLSWQWRTRRRTTISFQSCFYWRIARSRSKKQRNPADGARWIQEIEPEDQPSRSTQKSDPQSRCRIRT